jgi:hypothetical protein
VATTTLLDPGGGCDGPRREDGYRESLPPPYNWTFPTATRIVVSWKYWWLQKSGCDFGMSKLQLLMTLI